MNETRHSRAEQQSAELACAGTPLCAQRCLALGRAGLSGETAPSLGEAGECEVPSLLTRAETGWQIDGLDGELPDKIATGLAEYLAQHAESRGERQRIAEVKALYQNIHTARDTLYTQVLLASRGGGMTSEELEHFEGAVKKAEAQLEQASKGRDINELLLGRAAYDHQCLEETGIIFTDSMVQAIEKMVANTSQGKPTLLSGDKGIAKTKAVKYISQLIAPDKAPLVVTAHADLMSHELIGKYIQDPATGEFVFSYGPVVRGARDGRPVLVDEVNVGEQGVMMRLQDLLLLEIGKPFTLQENGEESITPKPGFVVFMTANEGGRYQGRQGFDTAFRDRLDVVKFDYPDASRKPLSDMMPETLRLAFASAVDTDGRLSDQIDIADLNYLARLAHVSQQLYSQPSNNVNLEGRSATNSGTLTGMLDDESILSNCITPRKMIDAIMRAQKNLPGATLPRLIAELLGGLDTSGSGNKDILTTLVTRPRSAKEVS